MEAEQFDFSVVFPNIAAQLRSVLGNLHLAGRPAGACHPAGGGSGAGFHSFPAGSELLPPAAAGEQSDGGGRAGAGRAPPRPGPGFDGDGPCGLCRGSGSVCAQKGPAGIPERCGLPHLRFSPALHRAAALPVALQCPEVYPCRRRGDRGAEIHQPMGPPVRVRHRLRYPGGPDPLPVRPLPSRRCDGAPAPRPGPGTALSASTSQSATAAP